MKRSTKAALLSGLVFPGTGHVFLKHYLRGSLLILSALVAFSVALRGIFQRALTIVDQIESGAIPLETGAIAEVVSNASAGADSFAEGTAVLVLGACWLIGIVDSYRLGDTQEK